MTVERKLMTAEELLLLPDDGMRHELIDGELRTMSPAGGPHGRAGGWISVNLGIHVGFNGLGEVLMAETGFLMRRNPDRVRAPDFAFVRADRMPAAGLPRGYIPFPADLVVEVVSPGDTAAEVREKVDDWLRFGARAVWVVYPALRLDAFLADGSVQTYGPDDVVEGGEALPGFRMRLAELIQPPNR